MKSSLFMSQDLYQHIWLERSDIFPYDLPVTLKNILFCVIILQKTNSVIDTQTFSTHLVDDLPSLIHT